MSIAQKAVNIAPNKQAFSARMQEGFDNLRLEGLYVNDADLDDLLAYDQGTMSKHDLLERVLARVKSK